MVIWYDNEWGYSNRVVDIVQLILKNRLILYEKVFIRHWKRKFLGRNI